MGKGGAATLDTSKDEPAQGLEERRGEERRRQTNKHNKESIDTRRQPAMELVGPLLAAVGGIGLSAYASSKFRNRVPKDTLGPHGFTKQWDNGQGFKIFSYFWPTAADKPKGILLLLHGHSIKQKVETARIFEFLKSSGDGGLEEEKKKRKKVYSESWIEELNKQGYSCCGIDVQAKRPKGYQKMKTYIKSFDD